MEINEIKALSNKTRTVSYVDNSFHTETEPSPDATKYISENYKGYSIVVQCQDNDLCDSTAICIDETNGIFDFITTDPIADTSEYADKTFEQMYNIIDHRAKLDKVTSSLIVVAGFLQRDDDEAYGLMISALQALYIFDFKTALFYLTIISENFSINHEILDIVLQKNLLWVKEQAEIYNEEVENTKSNGFIS